MVKVQKSLLRTLERLALNRGVGGRKRGPKRRGRRRQTRGPMRSILTQAQAGHAALLQRPFVANLPSNPCIYAGEQGTINRFIVDTSQSLAATDTSSIFIFHPNTGSTASFVLANPSTSFAGFSMQTTVGLTPGFNTLISVAQKVRSVASAIRMTVPNLSLTTVVGEFAFGVCSLDTALGFTNVNSAFQVSQARANITRDLHELRWYPGEFDSKYATMIAGATVISASGTDANDTNVMFVAIRGVPVSSTIGFQVTNVVEWTPKPASGLSVSGASSAGSMHQHTVDVLHTHTPGWHHTAKQTAERLLEDTVKNIGSKAGPALERAATRIFEGSLAAFGL